MTAHAPTAVLIAANSNPMPSTNGTESLNKKSAKYGMNNGAW
jgi:hypothetical protein